jgi:hypothetical protein
VADAPTDLGTRPVLRLPRSHPPDPVAAGFLDHAEHREAEQLPGAGQPQKPRQATEGGCTPPRVRIVASSAQNARWLVVLAQQRAQDQPLGFDAQVEDAHAGSMSKGHP